MRTFMTFLTIMALAAPVLADQVEIMLVDQKHGYCLDIKGGGRNIDPANGLQGHTCIAIRAA